MNILIGVVGKPRTGKDSVSDFLVDNHGFHKYTFANYLKWLCIEYFGYTKEEMWGEKTEESRRFLHQLGKLLTDMDPNFFVKRIIEQIRRDYANSVETGEEYRAVVSDVRTDAELNLFDRSSSTFLIPDKIMDSGVSLTNAFDKILVAKVERDIETVLKEEPGLENNIGHDIEALTDNHDNWDYYLQNNSTVEDLETSVKLMVSELTEESTHDLD